MIRALLGAALAAAVLPAAAGPAAARPGIAFDDSDRYRLVITAPGYRLGLSKLNGALVELVDRAAGARLVRGSNGCLWGAVQDGDPSYVGGCSYRPRRVNRFSYRWDGKTATLALAYDGPRARARVELAAHEAYFDLRLTLENHRGRILSSVLFPADLLADVAGVEAGYAPTYLPGVQLQPGFFSRLGNNVLGYPSRWAFADYLALDLDGGHLALSTVNPAPNPLTPVALGFLHGASPGRCAGRSFCVVHAFQTWVADGATWTSPVVRVRVGQTAEQSILAYRHDNGIDAYPSLAAKLGPRLDPLTRAPLVKADLWKGLHPFREWLPDLERLPSPALVHPVAFQLHGHDESYPDFLPPDPVWGSTSDFRSMVEQARGLGLLTMPYLNVSWWNRDSPTVRGADPAAFAVRDEQGQPAIEHYGEHYGYRVSPYAPLVRDRVAALMEQWRTEVPVDCVFFDQIGARPWQRDFNPTAPDPLAYDDGWLALTAPYADRCLMVEDGWDRLAQSFAGFHGGLLEGQREFGDPDRLMGAGDWKPYPLADWLLHDKVLLYQHDLYEGTMTTDAEVLSWNMAFGLQLSYNWDGAQRTLDSPWLDLVGSFQRALGPHYAGQALASYRSVTPEVTESVFGDLTVLANWSKASGHEADGYGIAPQGFLARSKDGGVLAGAFAGTFGGAPLSAGTHYLLVERDAAGVAVRQPVGGDTTLAVDPPPGERLRAVALTRDGQTVGEVAGDLRDGRFEFRYSAAVNGAPVASYRIAAR